MSSSIVASEGSRVAGHEVGAEISPQAGDRPSPPIVNYVERVPSQPRLRSFYTKIAALSFALSASGIFNPDRIQENGFTLDPSRDLYGGGALFAVTCVTAYISKRMRSL